MSAPVPGGRREHGATVLIAAMSSFFAVALISASGLMAAALDPEALAGSGTLRAMLGMVSLIFIIIALYVGAVVTANTFATVIAGRIRGIALLRLLGATSARVRRGVAAEGLLAGLLGACLGAAAGIGLNALLVLLGPARGWLPDHGGYRAFEGLMLLPIAVVALTTWAAAWVGSRRIAGVSPIAATGAAVEAPPERARGGRGRTAVAVVLMIGGLLVLLGGVALGLVSPLGLFVAFLGGLGSLTGIIIGAPRIMPPLLGLTGRFLGGGPTARLAAANAVRFPERSARATIGLVLGITLVTMFAVALASYRSMTLVVFGDEPEIAAALADTLAVTSAVLSGLVGFSAVIAAVGMANSLSLSVTQRTRELGLLRALGFTTGQIRRMIVAESAHMTATALGLGLLLGVGYGWAAAQSLLGSQAGLQPAALPWLTLGVVALGGVALAIGAALAPSRRATRVSPMAALAVE